MKLYREVDADDTDYEIKAVREYELPTEEILKMYDIRDSVGNNSQYYVNVARKQIIEEGNQSWNMIANFAIEKALNEFASSIEEWATNLLKGER